jgi:2,4-dienoyl-CoA reductase-like NADH-dependent reductase (Old Yellow Enzyme family)
MSSELFAPLTLRSGLVLRNRIGKAAMEEGLAGHAQLPDDRLVRLYQRWGAGGAGLLLTGNVMVHKQALTGPRGVVLDADSPLAPLQRWAAAGKADGAAMIMQISHPGRQVRANMPGVSWGPSAVNLDMGKHSKRFRPPSAMTSAQIERTIERFVRSAARAEQAGFDGVEIHGAHGYLLSQFLSPLANQRADDWGGPLEDRARLLLRIVETVRAAVSASFVVMVKLNSADFQRGGFDEADAQRVIAMLEPLGVDLVELSGGSYESPAMSGRPTNARTLEREAYFLDLAADLAATSPLPLMLTGGISRRDTAEKVLASGVAIVGMGTALAVTPDLPERWRNGEDVERALRPVTWDDKILASAASMALVRHQLRRIARGKQPSLTTHPLRAFIHDNLDQARALRRYRRWLRASLRSPDPAQAEAPR